MLIERPTYLNKLKDFRDKDLIKVVTGIRRCGKSTLFDLFIDYLLKDGVQKEQIQHINFEDANYSKIKNNEDLFNLVNKNLIKDKMNYIFLFLFQNVKDFQKACDNLYVIKNVDLYITGSNAYLLSGELSTLLSGRYVEIKMLPLSFKEYISYLGETDLQIKYNNYITNGSFPYVLNLKNEQDIKMYLDGIFNTIVVKDIATRNNIADISMLKDVIRFMFDNIGSLVSSTKIANTMTSAGRKITVPTVESYLNALVNSYVLYKATRYDIKGKQYLTSGSKYYLSDLGLRYYLLGAKDADLGHLLENVIYLELLRREYDVYVGKNDDQEADFVAMNSKTTEYYQVAYSAIEKETLERELKPLNDINDHNQKFLITMDFTPYANYNGIKKINALDWLLGKI